MKAMTKNLFGKITPDGLSQAKKEAAETVTEHEKRLLEVCCKQLDNALWFMKSSEQGLAENDVELLRE